ncbi:MAG: 50S ribosomal protein L15 [Thermotogae bacterium]|nr:50S ribosomal protein L15 [Thermotogota bacterium]
MFTLSNLRPNPGAKRRRKRVGRGPGSGHGKTAGRGHKGQKSRSGGTKPLWFEGGQTPIYRRIPKRGFTPPNPTVYEIVNLGQVDAKFQENEEVTPETLKSKGLVKGKLEGKLIKILAKGDITKALVFKGIHAFSQSAREKIEKAGGRIE